LRRIYVSVDFLSIDTLFAADVGSLIVWLIGKLIANALVVAIARSAHFRCFLREVNCAGTELAQADPALLESDPTLAGGGDENS
jgi:hypothetical protein